MIPIPEALPILTLLALSLVALWRMRGDAPRSRGALTAERTPTRPPARSKLVPVGWQKPVRDPQSEEACLARVRRDFDRDIKRWDLETATYLYELRNEAIFAGHYENLPPPGIPPRDRSIVQVPEAIPAIGGTAPSKPPPKPSDAPRGPR